MEKFKNNILFVAVMLAVLTGTRAYAQNEFYNNGSGITVQAGGLITVQGDLSNTDAGANIGLIDNSGLITLSGNWTNNSTSAALIPTTGSVEMLGANQLITGSQPTRFNNLSLTGTGVKTLNVDTYVAGNTGILALTDRPLDLNSNTLFVTNSLTGAITRTTGYIISETPATPGYGIIQWNVGNNAGNYIFPFGSLSAAYIPFALNVTTPGVQVTNGAISASTYPTNTGALINNRPLPTGVANLNNNCGTEHAVKMLDRFWVVNTNNYSTNPLTDKEFTYLDNEWDPTGASTNVITESDLQTWYYGAGWTHIPSTNNSSANIENLNGNTSYGVFTLGEHKVLNMQLLDVDSVVCFGESNGSIEFSTTQGYGSPTYSINTVSTPDTMITGLASGNYTVMAMDIMGCKDTISSVQVDEPAQLMLTMLASDNSICKNDLVMLTSSFSGGIKPYNVTWSNGVNNTAVTTNSLSQNLTPSVTTDYSSILTDYNNCVVYSDTVNVNVNALPDVNFQNNVSEGCQPLAVKFTNLSATTPPITNWLWNFGNGDTSVVQSPAYVYTMPGSFVVDLTGTSDSGCVTKYTMPNYILVHPKPVANFHYTPPSGIDFLNPEVVFHNTSTDADNSFWSFGDSFVSTLQDPTHVYSDTGTYQVQLIVSTVYNCIDSITMPVKVNEISTIYIPNAFTPDGNSLNDFFTPKGIDLVDYKMQIFDRWGEKIFESPDLNMGWDGTHRGILCKQDVYIYKIEFREKNGATRLQDKMRFGHVTLLKIK
ncbi:MAG: PKD domain-containing protein [Bacteroidota bacterium]